MQTFQKNDRVAYVGRSRSGLTENKTYVIDRKVRNSNAYRLLDDNNSIRMIIGSELKPAGGSHESTTHTPVSQTSENNSAWSQLLQVMESDLQARINEVLEDKTVEVSQTLDEMRQALRTGTSTLEVYSGERIGKVEGARHQQFELICQVANQRLPLLMVGMAGTGKTHAAEQVANALNLPFYAMSVGAQTSKSDIIGFIHAGGNYVETLFRKAFEYGGVFLMDEIDAGNANVLIQVNAALSNGYCAFPDGMVKKHDDFVFIASANTFGNGANRQYVGRNQLDAATLDRFVILDWKIDSNLETLLAGDKTQWLQAVQTIRQRVEEDGIRVLVTPRATLRGANLLASGIHWEQVAELALLNLFPVDKQPWAKEIISPIMRGA